MKIAVGFILSALCLVLNASGNNPLPRRHMIVFRHGARMDNHLAQRPGFNYESWQTYAAQAGWDTHDTGLTDEQTALQASIQSLLDRQTRPTIIITSPYLRSIQTARIIQHRFYQATGEFIGIALDQRLGEWPYAAFGRFDSPIRPVQNQGHRDITPANWDPAILAQEMTQQSGPHHVARIRAVLIELAARHLRPLVIGHRITAVAAHLRPEDVTQESIEQGSYVLAAFDLETTNATQGAQQ